MGKGCVERDVQLYNVQLFTEHGNTMVQFVPGELQ